MSTKDHLLWPKQDFQILIMCNHPSASFKHDSKQVIIHIKNGKQNINRVFQGMQGNVNQGRPLAPSASK